jgi:Phospholipase_D-nuclease N-terminal
MNVGGAESLFFIVFLPLVLAGFIVWVWALIDAIGVPDDSMYRSGNKLIWVLVIVFAQLVGAIVYLAIGRPTAADRARRSTGVPPPPPPR